jgi:putative Holliday junction resolvase
MDEIGRVLAVDYGSRNIGLAYSDELRLTVQPLPSIPNNGIHGFLKELKRRIETLQIKEVVVGMPLRMDGSKGDAALVMGEILETLKPRLKIPIREVDERLSTVEAMEYWQSMNRKQQSKYRTVDSLAAALILERFLKER